jgi:hypothetical protein
MGTKSPKGLYINLGEMYDKSMKDNLPLLSQFNRELACLYPFDYNKSCYNSEDFKFFKNRYSLTLGIRLVGVKIDYPTRLVFRTPVLYDISCMVPLFEPGFFIPRGPSVTPSPIVCIVLGTTDPICRGKILDEVISCNPMYIILTGAKFGENYNSTTTLMTRYLLKRLIDNKKIIKSHLFKKPDCILDCLEMQELLQVNDHTETRIACCQDDITSIQKAVRVWRRLGIVKKKISYYCPFY